MMMLTGTFLVPVQPAKARQIRRAFSHPNPGLRFRPGRAGEGVPSGSRRDRLPARGPSRPVAFQPPTERKTKTMSPMMEAMLMNEVVPRLRSAAPSIPKLGGEDDEEI